MPQARDLLFHGTSIYCLANIVEQDRLNKGAHWGKPGEPDGPRLSRSSSVAADFIQYNIYWGEGGILVFDRDRLATDFEIVRYKDKSYEGKEWPGDEHEEVPITPSIPTLSKYLVSIVCDPVFIEIAQAPDNLAVSREECGWGFDHYDDQKAIESLKKLASSPLLNRWIPPSGIPRHGNWVDRHARSICRTPAESSRPAC